MLRVLEQRLSNEEVVELDLDGEIKVVKTKSGKDYSSKSVILAPGAAPRTLNIKGEQELRGKGVSYCATCDADFFEELDVVVVGNGDAAVEEAMYLTKFAETVTIIVIHDEGILDCNKVSAEKAFANPRSNGFGTPFCKRSRGMGSWRVLSLRTSKPENFPKWKLTGVLLCGDCSKTDILKEKVELNEHGYIITMTAWRHQFRGICSRGC